MKKVIFSMALASLALAGTAMANEPYFPRNQRAFDRLDANHDGKLSTAELTPVMNKRLERTDSDGDKAISAAEIDARLAKAMERRRNRILQLLDTNHDGKVTESELDKVVADMFDSADANKDGAVDLAEIQSFNRGKWRKAYVEGKGGGSPN